MTKEKAIKKREDHSGIDESLKSFSKALKQSLRMDYQLGKAPHTGYPDKRALST